MSKIYAVALALVILAAPAMAADTLFTPPQDIDVTITVEEMASLWHGGNTEALQLVSNDVAPWHGAALKLNMLGNTDFTVSLGIPESDVPENTKLDIVTNADIAKWETYATPVSGSPVVDGKSLYWYYNPRTAGGTDSFPWFKSATDSNYFAISSGTGHFSSAPTTVADTVIASYDNETANLGVESIWNLFAVYDGFGPGVAGDTGTTTVQFTITKENVE